MSFVATFISTFLSGFTHIGVNEIGIIFAVVVMDASLSGDNSVAINALVLHLPQQQRSRGIYLGLLFAAVLRVIALMFTGIIIKYPIFQILGGLYLIKLCIDHFREEDDEEQGARRTYSSMTRVLIAIGFLDLSLSLDNVVAVVAMSQNLAVVVTGVLISIVMLAVASKVVQKIMERYPSLEPAAYIILAFLGLSMLAGHGSDFLVWAGTSVSQHKDSISQLTYKLSDKGEILGVAAIIILAIGLGEYRRRFKAPPAENSSKKESVSPAAV